MAVVVQCYHCSNILELDEGFRGGVCRCSQCGSLLQVPKSTGNETRKARPAAPGARVTPVQRPASPAGGDGGGGSGGVRTGDGGGSSGAFARSPMRPAAPGGAPAVARSKATQGSVDIHAQADRIKKSTPKLWVGIGLAVLIGAVLLIVVGTWIASSMREDRRPAVVGGAGTARRGRLFRMGRIF